MGKRKRKQDKYKIYRADGRLEKNRIRRKKKEATRQERLEIRKEKNI